MDSLQDNFTEYATRFTQPQDVLLAEIQHFTETSHAVPHMLSGHLQGAFLSMVSYMLRPRRILEIGTFTGFSALCLAKGLTDDGMLHTIEIRPEDAATAQNFFNKSSLNNKIKVHVGNAASIMEELDEIWDLVFIDADKTGYVEYFTRILPKIKKNGFILADNVFFHGQVLETEPKNKNAKAIKAFNDIVFNNKEIDKMMLPIRDGLYLIRKL